MFWSVCSDLFDLCRFLESVELQISLKNYDPQKDKRFSGTVRFGPLLFNPPFSLLAPYPAGTFSSFSRLFRG